MAPAIVFRDMGSNQAAGRETTAKHKKINSLTKYDPRKGWGWNLWVTVLRLPRRVEDGKGLDCCRGQEREKARRGRPHWIKMGCRTYGVGFLSAMQPILCGLG